MFKGILLFFSLSSSVFASDAKLFTPGPLTTTDSVKQAMLHDYGSRDKKFIEINSRVLNKIAQIAGVEQTHATVPMQGSGTFAVEAMLGSILAQEHKVLVLVNGSYGKRMLEIVRRYGKNYATYQVDEESTFNSDQLEQILRNDPAITHIAVVYCETTTGMLNPVPQIARVAKQYNKELLIDSMSAFGGLNMPDIQFAAMAASANKCLQGVPGMAFCLVRKDLLNQPGASVSYSLDLHDQYRYYSKTKQWRFTPPTHVILALDQALKELEKEGGIKKRAQRYAQNCQLLHQSLTEQGFKRLLPDDRQANIILTYLQPKDKRFNFDTFYQRLHAKGVIIYPGKLTQKDTFRVGCIGDLHPNDMTFAANAIKQTLAEMGVQAIV